MTKQTQSSDREGMTVAGALTVTVGSPSSSSIAPRLSPVELAPPPKLPAQASRSQPAAREDPPPERLLHCLQAETPNAAKASPLVHDPPSATFYTCPSFLAGDNTTRKTEPRQPVLTVTLQPGQAPPRTAPRQPEKRPPETAGAAALRLRVRGLGRPFWSECRPRPRSERVGGISRLCLFSLLFGLQVNVVAAASLNGIQSFHNPCRSTGFVYEGNRRHSHPKTLERHADKIKAAETTVKSRQLGLLN